MSNLMEKLALSKAIMDKADGIKNSNSMEYYLQHRYNK